MDSKELDLKILFQSIWRWKSKIFLFVFVVTSLSIVVSLMLPKWYKAKAVILAPQASDGGISPMANILGNLGLSSVLGGNENIFRYLAILKSRSLEESLAIKYDLQEKYKAKNMDLTLKTLEGNLIFEVGDESQIEISMYDKEQYLVAEMTNYVVYVLDSLNKELSVSNARNNRKFMEERVNDYVDSLETTGRNLAQFMEENGILSLEDQIIAGVEQAAILKGEIIKKEVELEVAKNTFSKDNPAISLIEFELNSLNEKYEDFINSSTFGKLMPNFSEVPDIQLELTKYQRKIEYYTRIIEYLGPLYEQQKFEEAKNIPTLQVLDYAKTPDIKSKPKRAIIVIIVFLLSGIFATTFAVIKENKK